jgi:hypothetical protein
MHHHLKWSNGVEASILNISQAVSPKKKNCILKIQLYKKYVDFTEHYGKRLIQYNFGQKVSAKFSLKFASNEKKVADKVYKIKSYLHFMYNFFGYHIICSRNCTFQDKKRYTG